MTTNDPGRDRSAVAIVGIGCRLPGGVVDAASFWQLLVEGRDAIGEIPADRVDLARFYDPRPATPGRMMTRYGGYLARVQEFDAAFFGIAPVEAECMDPHQRLLLETSWEALEDAGCDVVALEGTNAAVFMGQWTSDFENRLFADTDSLTFPMTLGSGRYAAAARVSYVFGLRGPSLTVDAACSSGLACVHLAVRSLREGECTIALAGAANLILQPHIHVAYSQSRMMAPDGRCKFGDASGNGYVRSEGVGVLALKTLARARADGDRIYAVIRGSAVNNDGRSSGSMGRPSCVGQEELLRAAYADAGVSPSRVGYVEAHGTGTRAGDPVELDSLARVMGEERAPCERAWVGSVKTNIGHTEATAGIAGLVKAALALRHEAIPPSLHFREPNPAIPWDTLPLAIPTTLVPWPRVDGVSRFAGVSAYGIGGTNAHVVLEEGPGGGGEAVGAASRAGPAVLALSARSAEALRELAGRHAQRLEASGASELHAWCAASARRSALSHRAAFVADDAVSMAQSLRRYAAGEAASGEGIAAGGRTPRIAFVCPGQGAQWVGMGRELAATEPVFREALERCDAAARPWLDVRIVEQLALEPGAPGYALDRIDVIQPVLVALAIAYAALWRHHGVEPDAVVGHSMGEVAAAHLAGVLDLDRAMQIICRRSALMRRGAGRGAMALVELSLEEAAARVSGCADRVAVAGNNSPRGSVISGEPDAVDAVLAELERDGVFARRVKVDVASHSPQMQPHALALESELAGLVPGATRLEFHSTVLGRRAEGAELDSAYWAANLRRPVLFGDTTRRMMDSGITHFIELGPHPVLLPSLQQTAQAAGVDLAAVVCGRRGEGEVATFLAALAGLWASGLPLDAIPGAGAGGHDVPLPRYPWQREFLWAEAAAMPVAGRAGCATARADPEALGWLHRFEWRPLEPTPDPVMPRGWVTAREPLAGAALASALELRFVPLAELAAALGRGADAVNSLVVLADSGAADAYLPLEVLHAIPDHMDGPRLWFVTRGAQALAADESADVEAAALWGAARVVGEEHPGRWGGLVDLDPRLDAQAAFVALRACGLPSDGEDQIAIRSGRRFALRLVPAPRAALVPFAWRADATYLVTGGLGGVAAHLIRDMGVHGARRFVLLGRTPLPARDQWAQRIDEPVAGARIRQVQALEALGLAVHYAAVDVADEAQVRDFLDGFRAQAWPPIRGVVHAAGSLENSLADRMDRATFDAALRAKLRGAQVLDRLLPDVELFVTVSSVGSFLPQAGQANYAAANAGLDALAQARRARARQAASIAWGVWRDVGLVNDEAGARNVADMERRGLHAFEPSRGAALFSRLCAQDAIPVAVLPADWAIYRRSRGERAGSMFRELGATASRAAGPALAEALSRASLTERRGLLEPVVRDAVGRVLKIAPLRLDPRIALGNMGLNSLMAMELRNRLEAELGRPLSATLAWNHPNVLALVEYLAGGEDAPQPQPGAAPAAPARRLDEIAVQVAAGSDEEAALALRRRPRSRP